MQVNLLLGDCLTVLRDLEENSIDSVVTDPPYGLAFMNKHWDYSVPSVDVWKEVFRVLKPGGHLLSFGGTRTYHRMVVNIEDAGFEIRDQIQWLYGQGFPKSLNLGNGWGTALKPANEPIVLARKPISEKTVADNVMKWGTGGINVDGSRIEGTKPSVPNPVLNGGDIYSKNNPGQGRCGKMSDNSQGRFPANLILDEEAGRLLDEQSGNRPSKNGGSAPGFSHWGRSVTGKTENVNRRDDSGGASRFFYCAKASKRERNAGLDLPPVKVNDGRQTEIDNPFQRGETLRVNSHPTVKPISLMEYLVRLITPPNGVVLDPFMGSGTTGIAAKNLGFSFTGIEREESYLQIAKARIEA